MTISKEKVRSIEFGDLPKRFDIKEREAHWREKWDQLGIHGHEHSLPRDRNYTHRHGSPGHGADHLLPAIVSPSITIPVDGGQPALGQWQRVVLVDLNADNPRRRVRLSFLAG